MKILFIVPELPTGGGTGNYFWQMAQATEKYTDWEAHVVSPSDDNTKEIGRKLSGFYPIKQRNKKMFNEKFCPLLENASEISEQEDFDLTYIYGDPIMHKCLDILAEFKNIICGIHTCAYYIGNTDNFLPITEQMDKIHAASSMKRMFEVEKHISSFHLISNLDLKIWQRLGGKKYVLFPNLLWEQENFGINFGERSNKILLAGRITTPQKGSILAKQLFEQGEFEYVLTVPKSNIAIARKLFNHFPNVEVKNLLTHSDVLKEMGMHKVFCNAGTYGPFDLTCTEAASQGCQIVANTCIGATEYLPETFIPKEHSAEGFIEQFRNALENPRKPNRILTFEQNIQNLLTCLHNTTLSR